ncbi:hypothetical protein R5R35_013210 [Gryllus longicercus]|uniref:Ankyrin repeat-containing protein n=1 Tax=Gryllus longicercus TaxID=2509291 RepID=A0AAN9W3B3_9ORTH
MPTDISSGEGATGGESAAVLVDAFQQVAQGLARLQEAMQLQGQEAMRRQEEAERRHQEAMRLQEQRAATALREAVGRMEAKLQEKDDAIRALEQRLEDSQQSVAVEGGRAEESPQEGALRRLESRMQEVEASLECTMQKFFPRVDGLLRQLEESPSPGTASSSSPISSSPSSHERGKTDARQGAAVPNEEPQRQGLERRIQEVKERTSRARATPCHVGEDLHEAVVQGRLADIRRLVESGADVNYIGRCGRPPLQSALTSSRRRDVVAWLLQRAVEVNAINVYGATALHEAARNDRSGQCLDLLIDAGADVNARNGSGATPLHWAANENNGAAVRALLSAGARRDLKGWDRIYKDKTPFDLAKSPELRNILHL